MKQYILLLLFIQLFIILDKTYTVKINSVVLAYYDRGDLYEKVTKDFNEYSKEKGLDIELKNNLYTTANTTDFVNEYGATLDHLLNKGSIKYDLYFYDVMYSRKYSSHFLDLRNWLSEDHLNMYYNNVTIQTCKYKDKWVGLPLNINYSILHFNTRLLEKYGKNIPKTWNELLETGKIIYDKELKEGNTDLVGYNGLVPDSESCICSILEFIYSFRENINSPFPGYRSQEAIDALNTLKEIKETLSTDQIYQENDNFNIFTILKGNGLFLKYWYFPYGSTDFKKSILLGKNEGVSGTTIGGFNIGVSKYIDNEHKKAAIEALKFFTSKEYQKKFTIREKYFSGITSLFDDEEVCKAIDCELAKTFQPIARSSSIMMDYDKYSRKFRELIFQFLYENRTAADVLQEIDDITRIYYMTISTEDTVCGLIIFIIIVIIIILMISLSVILYTAKSELYYNFLSKDLWLIIIYGCIVYISFIFTEYGNLTSFKCQIRVLLHSCGFTFTFIPILFKLISNIPINNANIEFVKKHKYLFILIFTIIDIVFFAISFINPYDTENILIDKGKNYRTCIHNNKAGSIVIALIILEKCLVLLSISLFIFIEWNMKQTVIDVRLIISAVYINVLLYSLLIILNFIDIRDYIVNFIIHSIIITLLSLSNYVLLYGIRILWIFNRNSYDDTIDINQITVNKNSTTSNGNGNSSFNNDKILSRILNYHYYTGSSKEFIEKSSVNPNN